MADQDLGLPVRLRDGDNEGVTSQVNGSQQALDVGINVAGVQVDPRDVRALTNADVVTAEQGTSPWVIDGTVAAAQDGAWTVAATQSGTWDVRLNDGAGNDITSSAAGGTRPLDVAMRDGSGNLYSLTNPLPVFLGNDPGAEVCDYNTGSAVNPAATSTHDYTVTALTTLIFAQVWASASARMKIQVQTETAAASDTFITRFVGFNSVASPNIDVKLANPVAVVAGARVRVIRTNIDNQAQDVYSTIAGTEI
jgi:hypothetical protein